MADIKQSKDNKKLLDSRPYTGIDSGFLLLYGNQHKIHNRLHESTIDSRAYTWIDFGFLSLHENWHQIPGPWWESLNPNSHHIKESWLWNTSVMEIKYGCQSTMRNKFQENMMNMMMNMMKKGHLYKGCALIGTRFVESANTALNNRSINIKAKLIQDYTTCHCNHEHTIK